LKNLTLNFNDCEIDNISDDISLNSKTKSKTVNRREIQEESEVEIPTNNRKNNNRKQKENIDYKNDRIHSFEFTGRNLFEKTQETTKSINRNEIEKDKTLKNSEKIGRESHEDVDKIEIGKKKLNYEKNIKNKSKL